MDCRDQMVRRAVAVFAAGILLLTSHLGSAQVSANQNLSVSTQSASHISGAAPSNAPLTLTLQDALQRAKKNSPQFQAALTDLGVAREDRVQSRAGMLPNVNFAGQALYTQPAQPAEQQSVGVPVRFIANNSPHEYVAQGIIHQVLSPGTIAEDRKSVV